jgi:DNA replication and repair protein RecF
MRLSEVAVLNFRNYAEAHLTLSPGRNFIVGRNAQGKSNLLQAITLLCLTKDLRNTTDEELLRDGTERFEVSGTFVDERELNTRGIITFQKGGAKQIAYNGKRLQRQAEYVGKFPIVVFSPESHRITSGPPSERRRFIDMLLCQGSPAYLADLQDYGRILRQRNAVLSEGKRTRDDDMLTAWDEALVEAGARIVNARAQFFNLIDQDARETYRRVDERGSELRVLYESRIVSGKEAGRNFLEQLKQQRAADWQRGLTTIGPHRDDVAFYIGEANLRVYGSRGEHKSVLMALKLIEAQYLREKKNTSPIVILDDFFSELDAERAQRCLALFGEGCQLMVSGVNAPKVDRRSDDMFVEIDKGRIINSWQAK